MRTPIIAGNWKMHKTLAEAVQLAHEIREAVADIKGVDIVLCPPFTTLGAVEGVIAESKLGLGAQNMYWEEQGAFTGEISPVMLDGLCDYVILGHSERRQFFGETDEGVNKKVKAALTHHLIPIVCVGENLALKRGRRNRCLCGGAGQCGLCRSIR
jgi:triosephosphate isomerase